MKSNQNEILDLFRRTGALLHGHFILRSGLHSRDFFQCALLLRDTAVAERVCGHLAEQVVESWDHQNPDDGAHQHAAGGRGANRAVADCAGSGRKHQWYQSCYKCERCHLNRSEA